MQPPARPLSLTVSFHFSWSNVLIFNYTYIGFTSSYTIHALYIYELFYIPILYLFYTHILHFCTVLYFNKNIYMIQPPILHSPCLHEGELFKISRALVFLELTGSGVYHVESETYFFLQTVSFMELLQSIIQPRGHFDFLILWAFATNQTETE